MQDQDTRELSSQRGYISRFFHSFRFRAMVVIILLSSGLILAISTTLSLVYQHKIREQKLSELRYTCNILASQMQAANVSQALTDEMTKELNWVSEYMSGRLLLVDDNYAIVFDSYNALTGKFCFSEEVIQTFYGMEYTRYNGDTQSYEFTVPIATRSRLSRADHSVNGCMIVSASASWVTETMNFMHYQTILLQIAGIMILIALAFILTGSLSGPWLKLRQLFQKVYEGDLTVKFDMDGGYTETEEIVDTFNGILERLRLLDESRQEFVSNVSHELKTPITSMRVLADSLLSETNVPVDIYREFMTDISNEIDRESKIINDLLSLVRLDRSSSDLNIEAIDINRLTEKILNRVRPIAKQRNIEIIFESFRPVQAEIDETKLSLAITNLVENGVKYNNDGGWVRISLNADHKNFFLRVADSGVGIPDDAREKIFERFYRVDKARSRETGGTGLGLAITKSVIQMHRGSIRVDSKPGEGTVFTVRIPLQYVG